MRVSSRSFADLSTQTRGTPIPRREHPFPVFVAVARAIWPRKTAANLAAQSHVTERAAKFWLAGAREPSAQAFKAVLDKIMERRR